MKIKFGLLFGALVALMLAMASTAVAASVVPVLIDPWQSGDADFECNQIGSSCDYSYKFDDWESAAFDGPYMTPDGATITISNDNGKTFDWSSNWPVCAVIVKAGTAANVFWYNGAYSDTGLYGPEDKDISHVTFCYSEPEMCWEDETAWSDGADYPWANWATYTYYGGVETGAILYAGQDMMAGMVYFAPATDGVTIEIELDEGWRFDPDEEENVKIQGYTTEPNESPIPGQFAFKGTGTDSSFNDYVPGIFYWYGVHVDVERQVPCEA